MNTIAAANLFENPLVLVAIVLVGALSNWLMKRRSQKEANPSPNEGASPKSPREQGRSTRQPTLQDALRELLGGEPQPPSTSRDSIPSASRNGQSSPAGCDEEQFHAEGEEILLDELPEPYEGFRQTEQVVERSLQPATLASVRAARVAIDERRENAGRIATTFNAYAERPVRAMSIAHERRSSRRSGTVPPWREPRTVRRAFIASLVFGSPKGLEA
jgi:hypothetical protein